jgi:hypothetical protein
MVAELAFAPRTGQMFIQELARPDVVAVHTRRLRRCARQKCLYATRTGFIRTRETGNHFPCFLCVGIAAYGTGHRTAGYPYRWTRQLFAGSKLGVDSRG